MNKDKFNQLIKDPLVFDSEAISELEQVVEDYPWNSSAQILLALAMNQHGIAGFDTQLHKASVYAGSRSHLFDLLQKSEPETSKPVSKDEKKNVVLKEGQLNKTEEERPEESGDSNIHDPLSQQILVDAVSRTIEAEVNEDVGSDREVGSEKLQEHERSEDAENTLKVKDLSAFSAWVYQRAQSIGYEISYSVEEKIDEKVSNIELVDRFIRADPKIERREFDELRNSELAKRSLMEDETIVTETMAKIYVQQGKIEKARRAYELLSLKYPEKSIYFADRIKRLSKK